MSSDPRTHRLTRHLPVALSFVAGYVDVCAFIALFGLFIAQITGTYIIAGASLVMHDPGLFPKLMAIPVFMAGAAVATMVARMNRRGLVITLAMELVLLAIFLAAGLAGAPTANPDSPANLIAAFAGFSAMGTQSALVRIYFAGAPSTNVMTTTSSQIAIDAADLLLARHRPDNARTEAARKRMRETLPCVGAFLVGAFAGAYAYAFLHWWCIAMAIAIVAAMVVAAWRTERG